MQRTNRATIAARRTRRMTASNGGSGATGSAGAALVSAASAATKRYSMLIPEMLAPTVYCPPDPQADNAPAPTLLTLGAPQALPIRLSPASLPTTAAAGGEITDQQKIGGGNENTPIDIVNDVKVGKQEVAKRASACVAQAQGGNGDGEGQEAGYTSIVDEEGESFFLVPKKHIFALANFHAVEKERDTLKNQLWSAGVKLKHAEAREVKLADKIRWFREDGDRRVQEAEKDKVALIQDCLNMSYKCSLMERNWLNALTNTAQEIARFEQDISRLISEIDKLQEECTCGANGESSGTNNEEEEPYRGMGWVDAVLAEED